MSILQFKTEKRKIRHILSVRDERNACEHMKKILVSFMLWSLIFCDRRTGKKLKCICCSKTPRKVEEKMKYFLSVFKNLI